MRFFTVLLLCLLSLPLHAKVNEETHDFSFEYGFMYHTLRAEQKSNGSRGRLTSDQNPYWTAGYTLRLGAKTALRAFGGIQLVRFNEPDLNTIKKEDKVFNQYGLELIRKITPHSKLGVFFMEQEHPIYFAKTPFEYEINKKRFLQSGLHYSIGQRRRIGMLWGAGMKGFFIFPTLGGDITTEAGVGGETYGRLGWVGPFGALYQIKGFYQVTTAPNADVTFKHESLGYCYQVSYSF